MPMNQRVASPRLRCALGLALAAASMSASAQVTVQIVGDTAQAQIDLDDGLGNSIEATFTLAFEAPQNLTVACLGLSADVLDAGVNVASMRVCPIRPGRPSIRPSRCVSPSSRRRPAG